MMTFITRGPSASVALAGVPTARTDATRSAAGDISLLSELQEYLVESLHGFRVPPLPNELSGRKMYSFLDLHTRVQSDGTLEFATDRKPSC